MKHITERCLVELTSLEQKLPEVQRDSVKVFPPIGCARADPSMHSTIQQLWLFRIT